MIGQDNIGFEADNTVPKSLVNYPETVINRSSLDVEVQELKTVSENATERVQWNKDIEFLLSCIALSVGLSNIWRFPYVAYENGGGAFVVPYIIIIALIGRPVYFMEMVMGQFSSRNSVRVYDCVPALRGIGMGQVITTGIVSIYYAAIMAITLRYFFDSFRPVLPWSQCRIEWGPCFPTGVNENSNVTWGNGTRSSAELWYL